VLSLLSSGSLPIQRGCRDDSPESRNPSRPSGQAYGSPVLDDSGFPNRRLALPLRGKDGDSRA